MTSPNSRIPAAVLDAPVVGTCLHAGGDGTTTLRAQLDPARPTMLVFLRHFGCLFCREMVKDVRIAADTADAGLAEPRYPRVVFVHQATPEQGGQFFGKYWPGAAAISDPAKRLYGAFALSHGSLTQMFGPRVWACALRATLKGHTIGRPIGDPWTMPGLFLLAADGRVLHRRAFAHAGDHPDFAPYGDVEALLGTPRLEGESPAAYAQPA